jgi:mRNA interferase YafQ
LNIYYTTQFKKDYKRIKKQSKGLDKLKYVIDQLASGQSLEPQYRDHQLSGIWKGHQDCHVAPDWILIYRISSDTLYLERMGSHSDLFE